MAERAQIISQEAGTKIASAMRDVIGAAAGIAGFAVESVRDLVQYMVRRGQMTQDEADRLIREAEEARSKRAPKNTSKAEPKTATQPAGAIREPETRASTKSAKKGASKSSAAATEKKPVERKPAAAAEKKPAAKKAAGKKKR